MPGRLSAWGWPSDSDPSATMTVYSEGSPFHQGLSDAVILAFRPQTSLGTMESFVRQRIPIAWTNCHLGGRRPWFICTSNSRGSYCAQLAAKLYVGRMGRFACRQCNGLAYASQRENPHHRRINRAWKIRERLGGSGDLTEPFPPRPKWMHRRTYDQLRRRADAGAADDALTISEQTKV
jgi:hypothetical protein